MTGRAAEESKPTDSLKVLQQLFKKGDYRDAAAMARRITLEKPTAVADLDDAFQIGLNAMQQLGNHKVVDDYRNEVTSRFAKNPRVLQVAGSSLLGAWAHHGTVVDGIFQRGQWGDGHVDVSETDRAQAIAWLSRAVEVDHAAENTDRFAVATLRQLGDALLRHRYNDRVWKLQETTDLTNIPDYNDPDAHITSGGQLGWPVDDSGEPIVYRVPAAWDDAVNDGERYRWTLHAIEQIRPNSRKGNLNQYAGFLRTHLGVGTIGNMNWGSGSDDISDDILSLRTLQDNETIAKLATGIRRFELPDDLNFIAMYQDEGGNPDFVSQIYLDRQQYTKAAELLSKATNRGRNGGRLADRYQQIVGNLGALQPFESAAAGQKAKLNYRFRNGKRVQFKAQRVDVNELIEDYKDAVTGRQPDVISPAGNIGWFLVNEQAGKVTGAKYLKETTAEWSVDLKPRAGHFDKTETIETPLDAAGVYLVTARMDDGNVSRVIVWLDDIAVVRKQIASGKVDHLYYVADAETGKPVANVELDLFGWKAENKPRRVVTSSQKATTDDQGLVRVVVPERLQWLVTAKTADGKMAFLNPQWIWRSNHFHRNSLTRTTGYGVTDRPIYRPEHQVQLHGWIRDARYDLGDVSAHANKNATVEITNPQGEVVSTQDVILDEFGGCGISWKIPGDAKLGNYSARIHLRDRAYQCTTFRIEEYRKPDFEVTIDQTTGAIELGNPIDVTIRAEYYAGGAVDGGTVSVKVERTEYNDSWYPFQAWDWLYGSGYGWRFFDDYGQSRGFGRGWFGHRAGPPELVLQRELALGPDGTAKITVDTEIAKTLFGSKSQQYKITAEVTDVSRRVVVANGSVVAAAKPFDVSVWTKRGFVEPGEQLPLTVSARRIGGGHISGAAEINLVRLSLKDGNVEEEVVASKSAMLHSGSVDFTLPIADAGMYRIDATVSEGDAIEKGSVEFVCRGEANGLVKDTPLTITADRREYAVGDIAKLLITTTQPGTQVLLFDRPENGQYLNYAVKALDGRAMLIEVPIVQGDMPNMFFEAVAIVDGECETAVAELFVPPASRALDVTVTPSEKEIGPGEEVSLSLKAVDANGDPHVGAVAMSVYDRSLNAIAGGAGAGDIRERFWSWKRSHRVQQQHSLRRSSGAIYRPNEKQLQMLGRFGASSDLTAVTATAAFGFENGAERKSRSLGLSRNAPMPSRAPMAADAVMDRAEAVSDGFSAGGGAGGGFGGGPGGEGAAPEPVAVRESFADTAFWTDVVTTNADGTATVSFTMPENLTAWSAKAWVVANGTRVGQGDTGIVTTKDVLVRVIAPRFLVDTDQVVLSGVVQNQTDAEIEAAVTLAIDGDTITILGDDTQTVSVAANSTARVDWPARAIAEGDAGLTVTARSSAGNDAMRIELPVKVHGFLRTESFAGVVRDQDSKSIQIVVPNDRRPEQSVLSVRVSPTVAGAIVESLPYLIEYPYGCTEQTLNRFLPAVVTRKTLSTLDVSLQEVAGMTAKLDPNVPDRANVNNAKPVFSDAELDKVVQAGVERLLAMQLSDGGWGWFSGFQERSYAHTTGVVVRGLLRAREADVDVPDAAIDRGLKWLDNYRAVQILKLKRFENGIENAPRKQFADHLDAMVEMVMTEADRSSVDMQKYLFRDRLRMSPIGLAMIGLAFSNDLETEQFRTLVSNLEQFFVGDAENGTAYLETPGRYGYWYWYGDDVEANAYALKLFIKAMPNDPRVSGLARYLLNNRRNATYWKSTRDTAIAVEALNEYLAQSGELNADVTLEIVVDGVSKRRVQVTRENLFSFDGVVEIKGEAVTAGPHTVELKRDGEGPLYYTVQSTNFAMESLIPKAGLELKTERRYWKLTPREQSTTAAGGRGEVVDIDVEAYERTPLAQNAMVESGTLVEVELIVETKNDYEYLLLEDAKAAGFEAVKGLSGYRSGFAGAYVEFRDDRVAMFFRKLNRGQYSIKYQLRAEQPGEFSALPARIEAMYAPTLVGNSDEQKLGVSELEE